MPAYLDYAATTPLDERVLERMLPYLEQDFGNPSSIHAWGQRADWAVEEARERVADGLGCRPEEVIFTSGGSESDNLALRGAAFAARENRGANHLLISPVEHDAVSQTAIDLAARHAFELEWLPVDNLGRVDPDDLRKTIRSDTALLSVIYGNNEIGTVNPIPELAAIARERGVTFHSDALQAPCQLPTLVGDLGVDLLSIGAHKFYGPKGVGVLFVRNGSQLLPIQTGGSQERGLRAGTHNVPLIVGLSVAHEIALARQETDASRFRMLRDLIIDEVLKRVPGARLTGHRVDRLPNNASFVIQGIDGNSLLAALDLAGFACSSGSACKTGDPEPSKVLLALGMETELALGSLRVTVGRQTTEAEVGEFLEALQEAVVGFRSPVADAS
ncbi:MAG: cysteine desulfurase [Chloroflexi bacterium]|nr:cysteine desulfurase [Chloroflexota bacterium]MDK1044278.1 cysteine desulfurase family protein [Anaerolineales bacterium]MCI0772612.1 cysteine desulfurase [Chloroflexota bacterium]MCI0805653.1 cysteine desulfurase [Chloroflexota bacterium]MCI0826732.1 cysteine desulfurase [Chloroflexota bacterium]